MRTLHLLLITALMVAMAGCASQSAPEKNADKPREKTLLSKRNFYIDDVPLPDNFKIDKDESWGYQTPTQRLYHIVAKGSTDVGSVVTFYKDRKMPLYEWRFVEQDLTQGRVVLHFSKAGENCKISVDRRAFTTYIRLLLVPSDLEAAK